MIALKEEGISFELSARGCDTEVSFVIAEGFFNDSITRSLNIMLLATCHSSLVLRPCCSEF